MNTNNVLFRGIDVCSKKFVYGYYVNDIEKCKHFIYSFNEISINDSCLDFIGFKDIIVSNKFEVYKDSVQICTFFKDKKKENIYLKEIFFKVLIYIMKNLVIY